MYAALGLGTVAVAAIQLQLQLTRNMQHVAGLNPKALR